MDIPCHPKALLRVTHDRSLTGMKRMERVQTIGTLLWWPKTNIGEAQHMLLLCDDVLTHRSYAGILRRSC